MIGGLITGDFEENTMTFEIEGEMTLQAGRYKIVQIEVGNQVKNNVGLPDVSNNEDAVCYTCQTSKGTKLKGDNYCNMCDHYF